MEIRVPRNHQSLKKILKTFIFGIISLSILTIGVFQWWRSQEIARLQAASQLIETSHGVIEYATFGQGPPVLVLHGTIGGYDQAQTLAEMLDTHDYHFISVSRPGYLRTPLATGASFQDQADAYAAFLDELEIDQVAVMAISGGGPPALQFALRHPDRTWGLIMIATNSDVNASRGSREERSNIEGGGAPPTWLLDIIFSDFASWVITSSANWQPQWFLPALVGEAYKETVLRDPHKLHIFTGLVNSFSLTSQRRIGSFNDGSIFLHHTGYPLETILTPMLILQGTEDSEDLDLQQRYLAETVPNSEYVEIEGGTHFMPASHNEVIAPLIIEFLGENRP